MLKSLSISQHLKSASFKSDVRAIDNESVTSVRKENNHIFKPFANVKKMDKENRKFSKSSAEENEIKKIGNLAKVVLAKIVEIMS